MQSVVSSTLSRLGHLVRHFQRDKLVHLGLLSITRGAEFGNVRNNDVTMPCGLVFR